MAYPLEIDHLVKCYDELVAVDDVSFSLQPGEIFGLLGPNGAGKTSLISVVTTLEEPTSGAVRVFGHDVTKEPKLAKPFYGVVPQEIINHAFFTVEEILYYHSGYYGLMPNKAQIEYLLKRLALDEHRKKPAKNLSGGMKRRLLIAKALLHKPKLLLLDEPSAGVDIELRADLWKFVEEMKQEGTTILLTTHYLEEAEALCDRIGIIDRGTLKKIGPTRELIEEMTQNEIIISLRSALNTISHPYLLSQTEKELHFSIPPKISLGELLSQLEIQLDKIDNIETREGTLEMAFQKILEHK